MQSRRNLFERDGEGYVGRELRWLDNLLAPQKRKREISYKENSNVLFKLNILQKNCISSSHDKNINA